MQKLILEKSAFTQQREKKYSFSFFFQVSDQSTKQKNKIEKIPPFTKSRTGSEAISDMQNPPNVSQQTLTLNPGMLVADKWAPTFEALARQGYQQQQQQQQQQHGNTNTNSSSSSLRIFDPIPKPRPGDWLADRSETGQTYTSYIRGAFRARPHASYDTISIVVLDSGVPFLPLLAEYVATFFQCKAEIVGPLDIGANAQKFGLKYRDNADTRTKQFYTTPLMDLCTKVVAADKQLSRRSACSIGITMFDLTPNDDYNFVYGIASLADGKGVFSLARFHPDFNGERYATEQDAQKIIFKRACKVLTHELTHIFGLRHCINYVCLMNGANHVGELERQPLVECPCCAKKLCCTWSWDMKKRYGDLAAISEKFGFKEEAERWKQCLEFC